jgi:hypothetical protein
MASKDNWPNRHGRLYYSGMNHLTPRLKFADDKRWRSVRKKKKQLVRTPNNIRSAVQYYQTH